MFASSMLSGYNLILLKVEIRTFSAFLYKKNVKCEKSRSRIGNSTGRKCEKFLFEKADDVINGKMGKIKEYRSL